MSRALPYYKMYPGDAETDENFRLMTFEQRGFYWTALNHAWLNDGLPIEETQLRQLFGISKPAFERVWSVVRTCFESDGKRLRNHRQEQERSEALSKSEKATNAVRTRYERSSNVLPRARPSDPDQDPETTVRATITQTPDQGSYESDFRAGLLARGFGNPENDPGVDVMIERTAAVCCQAGADPRLGAWMVADLIRTERCRGKPLEYLLGALRSQLSSPAYKNGAGLRKAARP